MLASDADIDQALRDGLLQISPTEPDLLQPASVDLRLDHRFRVYAPPSVPADPLGRDGPPLPPVILDPALDQRHLMREYDIPFGQAFVLPPYGFALGATLERVTVGPALAGKLEGKSSLGRIGLEVHCTAGWIDPGFSGHITLELFNAAPYPMRLWPGMKIAQLAVMAMHTPARRPYGTGGLNSRYQNQTAGPQPSQGWRNFRTWPTRQETTDV